MTRLHLLGAIAATMFVATMGCGYPSFQFGGIGGSGGDATSSTTTTTSDTTSTSSGPPPCGDHVVISELRTRGLNGGNDEFIELYNPTDADVILDHDWSIDVVNDTAAVSTLWMGHSGILPRHGHFLIATTDYLDSPTRDDALNAGITDAGRVRLLNGPIVPSTIDTICFGFDAFTLGEVGLLPCEGSPVKNPHDDTQNSNTNASLARHPRDCTDTDDNSKDFGPKSPATPQSSQSAPINY